MQTGEVYIVLEVHGFCCLSVFVAVVTSVGVSSSLGLTAKSFIKILCQSVSLDLLLLGLLVFGCSSHGWPISIAVVCFMLYFGWLSISTDVMAGFSMFMAVLTTLFGVWVIILIFVQ